MRQVFILFMLFFSTTNIMVAQDPAILGKSKITNETYLRIEPQVFGDKLINVFEGEEVTILDEQEGGYVRVWYYDKRSTKFYKGYLNTMFIENAHLQQKLRNLEREAKIILEKANEAEITLEEKQKELEKREREFLLIQKYGEEIGNKIKKKEIDFGMTTEIVHHILGLPDRVEKKTYKKFTTSHLIYRVDANTPSIVISIQSDKVIAIQDYNN